VDSADEQLLERVQLATRGAARLLRGMARRGKAIERDEPERAALLLAGVSVHPLYKGGRLAFDMLEVEDLMLDEPLDSALSTFDLSQVLGIGASAAARIGDELLRLGAERPAGGDSDGAVLRGSATSRVDVDGTGEASSLPRLQLTPARSDSDNGTSGSPTALDSMPELQSSDYLFDLFVLGFLDAVGKQSVGESGR
jgi:hypothetical protein